MISDVVTCTRADDIAHLMETMTARRIRHLPVVENDTLIGIVSIGDVVKRRIMETELEANALRGYITTG
jgi:CBS domain-containing protein